MPRAKSRQRTASKTSKPRTRVSQADAERVRRHLLSEQVQVLPVKDIRTMLRILNDVYPANRSRSRSTLSVAASPSSRWQPFLWGIGIGLVLLVLALAA